MNADQYKILFSEKALASGYSYDVVKKCLAYAEPLLNKKLPVIYNISHFAGLVGYRQSYIERAIVFTNYFYRHFSIKKANGNDRHIAEPLPSLKEIQNWVLRNVLYEVSISRYAKAYVPGMTLKQNVLFHKDQPIVLSVDVKDFFSSIRRTKVKALYKNLGYSTEVADLLSKICILNDRLPQGAPTSPYISNLIMTDFDQKTSQFAREKQYRYTRYADDITISGNLDVDDVLQFLRLELEKLGLEINQNKIRIMKRGVRQVVTGVVVNKKLQVSRKQRKKIRQSIHYITTYGLEEHLKKIGCTKKSYIQHLLGQVLFVLFINPEDKEFLRYKVYLNSLIQW